MSDTVRETWSRLQSAELVSGPTPSIRSTPVPWYVRFLLGSGGWLAAMFLLGLLALLLRQVFEESSLLLGIGLVMCVGAYLVQSGSQRIFVEQLALAVSLAGQLLALYALYRLLEPSQVAVGLSVAVFEGVLFMTMPGFVHRLWSAILALIGVLFAVGGTDHGHFSVAAVLLVMSLVWVAEFRQPRWSDLVRPLGYALTFVALLLTVSGAVDWGVVRSAFDEASPAGGHLQVAFTASTIVIAMVVVVGTVFICVDQEILDQPVARPVLMLSCLVAIASLWAPGIGPAYLVLLFGLAYANPALVVAGSAASLGYLGYLYFSTELSLLHKSFALGVTALIVFAVRFAMIKMAMLGKAEAN